MRALRVVGEFRTGQATEHSYRPRSRLLGRFPALTVIKTKRGERMPTLSGGLGGSVVGKKKVDKDVIRLKGYSKEQPIVTAPTSEPDLHKRRDFEFSAR